MKDRELLKLLLQNGWSISRQKGSHIIVVKGSKHISLPVHGKDMKKGLELSILKRAGLR